MVVNLVAELIKKEIPANQIAKEIAKKLGCSEKTVRNKINGVSAFTVPEAMAINEVFFNSEQNIGYLFDTTPQTGPSA